MENESMKRYFVTVTKFDGSLYTVEDRITGKYYPIRDAGGGRLQTIQEPSRNLQMTSKSKKLGRFWNCMEQHTSLE